ncbi:Clp protease N-terminal domain-containing protein [Allostreptomyces psammosilenae]|uniref:Clp R domain-containing protein n=1 Tax=Allostreptomyces psammosilenae TaxID=1892865 RepID=A0A853AAW4_9ACTN|nr:Clp protease N-terminal domain-containing protein [Allostreptomyces psammosilenae]NYI07761.1 hypothetical protein [Allostreptomyces psammosilenae]
MVNHDGHAFGLDRLAYRVLVAGAQLSRRLRAGAVTTDLLIRALCYDVTTDVAAAVLPADPQAGGRLASRVAGAGGAVRGRGPQAQAAALALEAAPRPAARGLTTGEVVDAADAAWADGLLARAASASVHRGLVSGRAAAEPAWSDAARAAVLRARHEAVSRGAVELDCAHLALGLLHDPENTACQALRAEGVDLTAVREALRAQAGRGGARPASPAGPAGGTAEAGPRLPPRPAPGAGTTGAGTAAGFRPGAGPAGRLRSAEQAAAARSALRPRLRGWAGH